MLLRLLDEHGAMTRGELSGRSGLSLPTVASIISDLSVRGYVAETGLRPRSVRRGPRAAAVALNRTACQVVGVYLGAGGIWIGRADLAGAVTGARRVPVEPGARPAEVVQTAVHAATPLVKAAGPALLGVGVAAPSPVDPAQRRTTRALDAGWRDLPVADLFEEALRAPAVVEYNVRAMALAEARHGFGRGEQSLLYVHVGMGVGFSFLVDGEPVAHGGRGISELGHRPVAPGGPICACGAVGCLEAVLREPYLRARVVDAARGSAALAGAARRHPAPLHALNAAAHAGDDVATGLLAEYLDHLTTGVAMAADVLSPSCVTLGGTLGQAPKEVFEQLREELYPKLSTPLRDHVTVQPSAIRPHPGVLGAATVAFDRLFYASGPANPADRGVPMDGHPARTSGRSR